MRALTSVELEPSEDAPTLTEIFSRHCFRLAHYRAIDRLADFLSDVQQRLHKGNGSAGERFHFPLSQQQMGELLGMSTVHVNRTLQALRPILRIKDRHAHIQNQQEFAASLR